MIKRVSIALVLAIMASSAAAETIVAAHAIRAQSIISEVDLVVLDEDMIGGISDPAMIIGQEARVNLYPGRVIHTSDIGRPAILERNQMVVMTYVLGSLTITAEGRVLDRAGVGERVRVMNMDSRLTVIGQVMADGTIEVGS